MPALKGTEVSLSYVQCFLYLVSSSINVSIFHIAWLDTFWTDLVSVGRIPTTGPPFCHCFKRKGDCKRRENMGVLDLSQLNRQVN